MRSATRPSRRSVRLGALRLVGRALSGRPARTAREPRRVLLVRPDHIGDVLLTSPAVALLRESLPHAHLTYVVGPWSADAASGGPAVDRLRRLPFPGFTRRSKDNLFAPYGVLLREGARLRREHYDLAVVFRPDHWWGALLALVAGVPVRIGGRTPETTPLLTHARAAPPGEHATQTALELARLGLDTFSIPLANHTTGLTFRIAEAHRATARRFWASHALEGQHVVAVAPSAGAALKTWPLEWWASLADRLVGQATPVLLVGGPDDAALLASIQARMARAPAATACGQALGVSAALFEQSALFIGLDGGQAHLASAVGTPTIRLYGPASSQVYGPWPPRPDQRVLVTQGLRCVACGNLEAPPCGATTLPACLLALTVDDVLNAVGAQLQRD